jgi:hypothetical protein
MSVVRLGVIADSHLALERVEDASWHNPYRPATVDIDAGGGSDFYQCASDRLAA